MRIERDRELCPLCAEGMPIKKYFDGRMMHFDGLMAWSVCPEIETHDALIVGAMMERMAKLMCWNCADKTFQPPTPYFREDINCWWHGDEPTGVQCQANSIRAAMPEASKNALAERPQVIGAKPICLDCNAAGIVNCSHFDNCGGKWVYKPDAERDKCPVCGADWHIHCAKGCFSCDDPKSPIPHYASTYCRKCMQSFCARCMEQHQCGDSSESTAKKS